MKILIINSVPLNAGDQALLQATAIGLNHYLGNTAITVLCHDPKNCKKYLPQFDFYLDYDRTYLFYKRTLKEKAKQIIRKIISSLVRNQAAYDPEALLASETQKEVYALFKETDLIISSPGGYLHDFYGYEERLKVFQLAFDLGKPVILFGQSIGPFWKKNHLPALKEALQKMNLVILRERFSFTHIEALNTPGIPAHIHTDIAFGLRRFYPDLFQAKTNQQIQKIAMAFRPWRGSKETADILEKAVAFCTYLLSNYDLQITFLSTCQGIADYYDDSLFAQKIVQQFPKTLQSKCTIDPHYHDFLTLIKKYRNFDAYIGMRLHGAIFSMLGGTPAMNIAYEDKTAGIYEFLDLSAYQIDYTSGEAEWEKTADHFLQNHLAIRAQLPASLDRAAAEVHKSFLLLKKNVEQ